MLCFKGFSKTLLMIEVEMQRIVKGEVQVREREENQRVMKGSRAQGVIALSIHFNSTSDALDPCKVAKPLVLTLNSSSSKEVEP